MLFQRESEADILKFEIVRYPAQRFSQRVPAHQPVRNIWVFQVTAGDKPHQKATTPGDKSPAQSIVPALAVAEHAIMLPSTPEERLEKCRVALAVLPYPLQQRGADELPGWS